MRKVQCEECGRQYDYDVDDFCPRCGAFNQPPRNARVGADGSVIRVDGINEQNHRGSFVHRELHEEDRERRRTGLERGASRRPVRPVERNPRSRRQSKHTWIISWIVWMIVSVFGLSLFVNLVRFFLAF